MGDSDYNFRGTVLATYFRAPPYESQVLKGVGHIASLGLSCKEFTIEHIRMSLDGDIKISLFTQIFLILLI